MKTFEPGDACVVLSDIHGNIEALEAVIRGLRENDHIRIRQWFCLGDTIGYNPNPNRCVATVRRIQARALAGNHDHAAIHLVPTGNFNREAREAIKWTQRRLSAQHRSYLKTLPFSRKITIGPKIVTMAHGSPEGKRPFAYLFRPTDIRNKAVLQGTDILMIGHTHVPGCFTQNGNTWTYEPAHETISIKLKPEKRYMVNAGSVGQPRDGRPQASYVLFFPAEGTIVIKRIEYPIREVQRKIIEAGLPTRLAERLEHGR